MDASGFLLDLVKSVLDLNKLECGEIRLEEKSFDIKEIIENSIDSGKALNKLNEFLKLTKEEIQ